MGPARPAKHGSKWIRRSTRLAIYHRDGFACVYCRSTLRLTLDHVTPSNRGGRNAPHNLVTACFSCNSARQALTMRSWYRRLREQGVDTKKLGGLDTSSTTQDPRSSRRKTAGYAATNQQEHTYPDDPVLRLQAGVLPSFCDPHPGECSCRRPEKPSPSPSAPSVGALSPSRMTSPHAVGARWSLGAENGLLLR